MYCFSDIICMHMHPSRALEVLLLASMGSRSAEGVFSHPSVCILRHYDLQGDRDAVYHTVTLLLQIGCILIWSEHPHIGRRCDPANTADYISSTKSTTSTVKITASSNEPAKTSYTDGALLRYHLNAYASKWGARGTPASIDREPHRCKHSSAPAPFCVYPTALRFARR
jgi:hypothetical protein